MKLIPKTKVISFGAEREAAFQHAKTRSVVSFPLPNGSIYVFSKDVNIEWRHGILPIPEKEKMRMEEYLSYCGDG